MRLEFARAFEGPNLVAPYPAARWVVFDLPIIKLTTSDRKRACRIFTESMYPDAEGLVLAAKQSGFLLAELMLRIQQAGRHPVERFQANQLEDGKIELVVELLRPSLISCLGDLARTFWHEWSTNANIGAFARCYQNHREKLRVRSAELLRYDRLRWAQRLGLSAHAQTDSRMIAVLGQRRKAKMARNLGRMARQQGHYPALLLRDGLHRPDRLSPARSQQLEAEHRSAELDPVIDTVIAEWRSDPLARHGSPVHWLDSLIFTDARPRLDLEKAMAVSDLLKRLRRMAVNLTTRAVVLDGAEETLWSELAGLPTELLRPYWSDAQKPLPTYLQVHTTQGGLALQASEKGLVIHYAGEPEVFPWTQLPVLPWQDPRALSPILTALATFFPMVSENRGANLQQLLTPPPTPTWITALSHNGRWCGVADPRDRGIKRGIEHWLRDNPKGRLWLLWDGHGVSPMETNGTMEANHRVQQRQLGNQMSSESTLAQGVAETESLMTDGDGILLLIADESQRLRSFRALNDEQARPSSDRYQALARLFAGRWVNGTWLAEQLMPINVATMAPYEQLVVIPYLVDDYSLLKARLLAAFQQGALGAIAAAIRDDLPRWWPVLVCDDPLSGWRRCGKHQPQMREKLMRIAR